MLSKYMFEIYILLIHLSVYAIKNTFFLNFKHLTKLTKNIIILKNKSFKRKNTLSKICCCFKVILHYGQSCHLQVVVQSAAATEPPKVLTQKYNLLLSRSSFFSAPSYLLLPFLLCVSFEVTLLRHTYNIYYSSSYAGCCLYISNQRLR